jgi:hypothetical protein
MDNASYHSCRKEPIPTKSWTKVRLQEWLTSKGIEFPPHALKSELWTIVERKKPRNPTYIVDEIATAAGMSTLLEVIVVFNFISRI